MNVGLQNTNVNFKGNDRIENAVNDLVETTKEVSSDVKNELREISKDAAKLKAIKNDVLEKRAKGHFEGDDIIVAGSAATATAVKVAKSGSNVFKGGSRILKIGGKVAQEATEQVVKNKNSIENLIKNTASKFMRIKGLGFIGRAMKNPAVMKFLSPFAAGASVFIVVGHLCNVAGMKLSQLDT